MCTGVLGPNVPVLTPSIPLHNPHSRPQYRHLTIYHITPLFTEFRLWLICLKVSVRPQPMRCGFTCRPAVIEGDGAHVCSRSAPDSPHLINPIL